MGNASASLELGVSGQTMTRCARRKASVSGSDCARANVDPGSIREKLRGATISARHMTSESSRHSTVSVAVGPSDLPIQTTASPRMAVACAALAVDMKNPCGAHGYAVKPKISSSLNAATRKCYEFGGKECVIRAWACDAKG